ncbi:MAG: ligand-binding sensor domain-containing protein/signal transduction histidine kinase [Pseudohongiellaceae bacterium]|jgi:ligand-binding sensor domain-containing protein/signal transduction histidine kinase/DNA-binding response OmpR family regulator
MDFTTKSCLIIFFCIIFCTSKASGQKDIEFDHITVEDGLSHNGIRAIAQDSMGLMWFGTEDGLNKYDTREFKIYRNIDDDSTSISSSFNICALLCDRSGNLWSGTDDGLNKYSPKSNSFRRYVHDKDDKKSLSNNRVITIASDKSGALWVGTVHGLNKFTSEGIFQHFFKQTPEKEGLAGNFIRDIYPDKEGNIWVGTNEGLTKIYYSDGKYLFKNFDQNLESSISLKNQNITAITGDDMGNLWISTQNKGFIQLDLKTERFKFFNNKSDNKNTVLSNNIRKILFDGNHKLWIATLKGLSIYNLKTGNFQNFQSNLIYEKSLSHNSIYDIFKDKSGSIWLATFFGGISVYHPNETPFQVYYNKSDKNSLSGNIVSNIKEDENKNLWIGTEGEGLSYYNRTSEKFTTYKNTLSDSTSVSSNLIKAVSIDNNGRVWIGSHNGGLDYFDSSKNEFINYVPNPNDPGDLFSNNIYNLLHDSQSRFWVGTNNSGLYLYDKVKKSFKSLQIHVGSLNLDVIEINNLFEDSFKNIWVSSNRGLYVLKNKASHFKKIEMVEHDKENNNKINFVHEDSEHNIWIGGYNIGLVKYSNGHQVARFTEKEGLPSSNILGMLEDGYGNFWISTNKGLSKYNGKYFKTYTMQDGLPSNVFNINSYFKDYKGKLFFGTYKGLLHFYPEDISENSYKANLVFTNLLLSDYMVKVGDSTSLLNKSISYKKELTFSYDQNIFTLEFALLNFKKSKKNTYAYKLDGYNKEWIYTNIASATYTDLPSGTYTFYAKASNNDGIGNDNPIELLINIKPPFWRTWWAYLIYFCVISSLLFMATRYFVMKARLKRKDTLHQIKLDFFTEISHEIRTPLTLIQGPLENLVNYDFGSQYMSEQFLIMRNNVIRLSKLINELLDFRKMENKEMKLNVSEANLVPFVKGIFLSFKYLAIENNVTYNFICEKDDIPLYFDKEQLEKVLFNLLSNAFKFLLDNGKVEICIVEVGNDIEVRLIDNGRGVPADDKENIFKNFYQSEFLNNKTIGTGIGLALSKKIAELHHGSLILENSKMNKSDVAGSCFVLILKKGMDHFSNNEIRIKPQGDFDELEDLTDFTKKEKSLKDDFLKTFKYSILLVEDNDEVRNFIKSSLEFYYNVYESENGVEGWNTAIEQIPDLIISDVMMPEMDGLELCEKLKTDERTNHIPVILLTARSGDTHKISGLKTRADVYLTKPFSMQVLLLNIGNLLSLSEKLRVKFSQEIYLQPTDVIIDTKEQEFISKVLNVIEENMDKTNFGVHDLSAEIGMSSPVFYKKIKFLTGMSVNNFMKSVKLKRAAQLLQQSDLTVYQVAFEVGFKNSKYFSKEFRKEYGKYPSDFASTKE